jgi:hypothetical protein
MEDKKIEICTDCFNCKTKMGKTYCKLGLWKEDNKNKSILYTPVDFGCNYFDED